MDAISYGHAAKQAQRIKKFIENPDSISGVLTQPSVIQTGETVTVPTGRTAILANTQIDGTLNVEGDVFIPSGATLSGVVEKVVSTDNAVVRFDGANGDVQNSNVIIDDSGELYVPGGISLPNTNMEGNVLDYYEEGSFTPTVKGNTTDGVGTYVAQKGVYTRIGDTCFFTIYVSISAHTGTGGIKFSGLPFVSKNEPNLYNGVNICYISTLTYTGTFLCGYIPPNTSYIVFEQASSGSVQSSIPMDTTFTIMIGGHYKC